jgi:hypothetical protein
VQSLKTMFLYTQSDKETVEEYGRNFRSLWDTVEAFGGSPGVHEGLVRGILSNIMQGTTPTAQERSDAEEASSEAVKAALLISSADRHKYGKIKDELANNYLLGTDQYPDTFEKALCIFLELSNHDKQPTIQAQSQRHRCGVPPTRGERWTWSRTRRARTWR